MTISNMPHRKCHLYTQSIVLEFSLMAKHGMCFQQEMMGVYGGIYDYA